MLDASDSEQLLVGVARTGGGQVAGWIVEVGGVVVLRKVVTTALHLLRWPEPSWAFDAEVLARVSAMGVERVEVYDERGDVWWCSLPYLMAEGRSLDRGHGVQVRLPLNRFSFLPARARREQSGAEGGR